MIEVHPIADGRRLRCQHEDGCDEWAVAVVISSWLGIEVHDPVCGNEAHAAAAVLEAQEGL